MQCSSSRRCSEGRAPPWVWMAYEMTSRKGLAVAASSEPEGRVWRETRCSWWSQLTFAYVTPLLVQGARATLGAEDLPGVSPEESVERLRAPALAFGSKMKAMAEMMRAWRTRGRS